MELKKQCTYGKWHVSIDGTMTYDKGRYEIDYVTLEDNDWILHMSSKGWIDWNDFIPVYIQAHINAGIEIKEERFYYQKQ